MTKATQITGNFVTNILTNESSESPHICPLIHVNLRPHPYLDRLVDAHHYPGEQARIEGAREHIASRAGLGGAQLHSDGVQPAVERV